MYRYVGRNKGKLKVLEGILMERMGIGLKYWNCVDKIGIGKLLGKIELKGRGNSYCCVFHVE